VRIVVCMQFFSRMCVMVGWLVGLNTWNMASRYSAWTETDYCLPDRSSVFLSIYLLILVGKEKKIRF
jgi:hypothetical protein